MRRILFTLFTILCAVIVAPTQETSINFGVYDGQSGHPVDEALVFLDHSTYSTYSNSSGKVSISFPDGINQPLIVYRKGYDRYILEPQKFPQLLKKDSIFLFPDIRRPDELIHKPAGTKNRKKNIKRFKKALFGSNASKCRLLNPEVLQFETGKNLFKVTTSDKLQIENEYLGYKIYYLLDEMVMDKNGEIQYSGRAMFTDYTAQADLKKLQKNRNFTYTRSQRYFFRSLLEDRLSEEGYKIRVCNYGNGKFTTILEPNRNDLLRTDTVTGLHTIQFPEFLEVTNRNIRNISENDQPNFGGGPLGQRYDNTYKNERVRVDYAVSYFYNLSAAIEFNDLGMILNPGVVKVYGYWANKRLSTSLPVNYNNK